MLLPNYIAHLPSNQPSGDLVRTWTCFSRISSSSDTFWPCILICRTHPAHCGLLILIDAAHSFATLTILICLYNTSYSWESSTARSSLLSKTFPVLSFPTLLQLRSLSTCHLGQRTPSLKVGVTNPVQSDQSSHPHHASYVWNYAWLNSS